MAAAVANPAQAFIDSDVGQVVATTLHSAGAILYLGGVAAYLVWHRHLAHGQHQVRVLAGAAALTYLAILANLVGGFMRTYQEGHPGLSALDESPWVRVMAVKHLFLFVGMAAAVYLFEAVARRLLRAHQAGTLARPSPPGHRVATLLVGSSILAAAVLGALSQVAPIDAGDGETDGEAHPDGGHGDLAAATYHNATGQLTSTPVAPAAGSSTFTVPANSSLLQATLAWTPGQFDLRLALTDPGGQTVTFSDPGSGGRLEAAMEAPLPGGWAASVESDVAVGAGWTLSIRMDPARHGETFLAETVVLAPNTFFEINTAMEAGASLHWDWRILEATPVHFDVHSHFDDEVQTWVEEEAAAHAGGFTNERAGGYSLLWENGGAVPVRLAYRAWGGFVVDSYFPPR